MTKITLIILLIGFSTSWDYIHSSIPEFVPGTSGFPDSFPTVAALANGNYVVAWHGLRTAATMDIYYTILSPTGKTVVGTTIASILANYYMCSPSVTADDKGGFLLVWNWRNNAPLAGTQNDILLRYITPAYVGGNGIRINAKAAAANEDSLFPNVAITTGGIFLIAWSGTFNYAGIPSVMSQIILPGMTPTTFSGNVLLSTNSTYQYKSTKCKTLGNNNYVCVYHTTQYAVSNFDVAAVIMDEVTATTIIKAQWLVNTANTTGNQYNPNLEILSSGNFLIIWADQGVASGGDILVQAYTNNGTALLGASKVNTTGKCDFPSLASLGNDGAIASYVCDPSGTGRNLYYQMFSTLGVGIGTERMMNTVSNLGTINGLAIVPGTGLMAVYSAGNNVYAQMLYKDLGECSSFTMYYSHDPSYAINFNIPNSSWVVIRTPPQFGTLKKAAGTALNANSLLLKTDISYFVGTVKTDSFFYSPNYIDNPCKVTLIPCYDSCGTCSKAGTPKDHNCNNCYTAGLYYPLVDKTTNCYNASSPPDGYYFDTDKWLSCFTGCKTCTSYPTMPDQNMLCGSNSCITGYFPKEDNLTSCFKDNVDGYFLDVTLYKKCYSLCKTCTAFPTAPTTDMKCKSNSCVDGYRPKSDNMSSCFNDSAIPGYLFDNSIYQKCFDSCQDCTATPGTAANHFCSSCKSGYFAKVDNNTSCFTGTVPQYYISGTVYKNCYSTCNSCTTLGDSTDHKCTSCNSGYFTKSDNTTSCFTGSIQLYYLDSTIYKNCYSTCQTCNNIAGNSSNHQCISCVSGYYTKEDNITSCFNGTIPQYYFDGSIYKKCYPSCGTCSVVGNASDHKCDTCITNNRPKIDTPKSCFTGNIPQYYNDGSIYQKCYNTCDTCKTTPGTPSDHQCNTCINGYYPKVDQMTSCFTGTITNYFIVAGVYQKCYSTCQTCTTIVGTSTDHQCTQCVSGYYTKTDNTTSCFTGTVPQYFLDTTNSKYQNCYSTCSSCSTTGNSNNHQCDTCNANYHPKVDNMKSCFTGTISKYYYDAGTGLYQQCYSTCDSCKTTPGNSSDHQCNSCVSGYYPKVDQMTSCFNGIIDTYFFDGSKYQKCYSTCATCSLSGNTNNHQCSSCVSQYYPKADNMSSCFTGNIATYFFDGSKYQNCYSTCQTCTELGDAGNHKCNTCVSNYYGKADNPTSCFTGDVPLYYFDGTVYQKCYSTCDTCKTTQGNDDDHQCKTCTAGYYPKIDNKSSCFTGTVPNYFLINGIYQMCYPSCATCTKQIGTPSNHQCTACQTDHYPKADNKSSCFKDHVSQYYFDGLEYQNCYSSCEKCEVTGRADDHQCTECFADYFPKEGNQSNCFTGSIKGYYLNENIYQKCHPNCDTCNGIGNVDDHKCTKCPSGYYSASDRTTSCFTGDIPFYYFDNTVKIYQNCYKTCGTCKATGDDSNHNCATCNSNYFPIEGNPKNCYTGAMPGYSLDVSMYKKCYKSCETCTDKKGTPEDHQCEKCTTGYLFSPGTKNCFITGLPVPGYIFDAVTGLYTSCFRTCGQCEKLGNEEDNKCFSCATNYYPVKEMPGQCKPNTDVVPFNYFDTADKQFLPCYKTCSTCFKFGTETSHNCIECKYNSFPLLGNNKMCYGSTDSVGGYFYDEKAFLFKPCYETCSSCFGLGDKQAHLCSSCADLHYPLEDDKSRCYKESMIDEIGYYFDKPSKIFKKCYNTCATCDGAGDIRNPKCKKCADGSEKCKTGCTDITYNGYCLTQCPDTTIYDSSENKCVDCKKGQIVFENNCLDKCYDGYVQEGNTCVSCKSKGMLFSENKCIEKCPGDYMIDSAGSCVKPNRISKCWILTKETKCEKDTCGGNGKCSIRFNFINCECPKGFIGMYCQVDTAKQDINDYIGKLKD
jgi:hypothetical protein